MNSINLTGRLTAEPELKNTTNGKSVLQATLAVKRPRTKDTTDFITVVIWNQAAEYVSRYAKKGSLIAVSGCLTSRKWEDKQGNKRTSFEVIVDSAEICEGREKAQGENLSSFNQNSTQAQNFGTNPQNRDYLDITPDENDQDLPF